MYRYEDGAGNQLARMCFCSLLVTKAQVAILFESWCTGCFGRRTCIAT